MGLEIRTFDGDFKSLGELLCESWRADYGSDLRFHYSDDFLRWTLSGPKCDPELQLAAYLEGKMVGFCARLPKTLWARGATHEVALGTFLTTGARFRRRGIGKGLVEESMNRLKARGYAGYFTYLQRSRASTPLYQNLSAPQLVVRPSLRFYFRFLDGRGLSARWHHGPLLRTVMSLLSDRETNAPEVPMARRYRCADLTACVELMNARRRRFPVCQQWSAKELDWRLEGFPRSQAVVYERDGRVQGFVSFYSTELSGDKWGGAHMKETEREERVALIDHLVLDGLRFPERNALMARVLFEARAAGNALAIVPSSEGRGLAALLLRHRFLLDVFTPPVVLHWIALTRDLQSLCPKRGGICFDFL